MLPATKQIRDFPQSENGRHGELPQETKLRWLPRFLANALPSHWERVTVNKNVESVTVPRWIAIAILTAVMAFGIQQWWSRQAEHDTLIEIRTELRLSKETQADKDRILNGKLNDLDQWKTVVSKDQREIIGMLKQQQIDALGRPTIRQPQYSQ